MPVYSAVDVGGIGSVALAVCLWGFSKAVLAGALLLVHLTQRRWRSVPPPLFDRRAPVGARTRLGEWAVGVGAGYALCAIVFFCSMVGQPTGASLFLEPMDGGPADQAGVAPGDRALSVEGRPVKTFDDFREAVARGPATLSIEVERKGRTVPLSIRKDQDNRIGVAPRPEGAMGAAAAAAAAVTGPAMLLASWLRTALQALSGEVSMIGPAAVGLAASKDSLAGVRMLGMLMAKDFGFIALIYTVVLVADTRSRARYQAALTSPDPTS